MIATEEERREAKEYCLRCSEVWGGIRDIDACTKSGGLIACLYSQASDGGKGGDIYFLSTCNGNRISRVAVADVVGHGEEVSQISQWLYDSMFQHLDSTDCANMLNNMNQTVYHRGLDALTTAAVFTYYTETHSLNYSYAGHHPLILKRKNEPVWRELDLATNDDHANIPLGILADANYDQQSLTLRSGDLLFVYTDGVIETRDPEGRFYGKESILEVLNQSRGEMEDIKNNVVRSLHDFSKNGLNHDDVTFMVVEIL